MLRTWMEVTILKEDGSYIHKDRTTKKSSGPTHSKLAVCKNQKTRLQF
jgi:hypothetical protein